MSTMYEQETTVTSTRGDEWVFIYTANPFHIAKLDAEDRAEATSRSTDPDEPWANYRVRSSDWNPLGGFKRRLSEEQRQALSERARERFGKM